jgi:hypothetical protein
MRGSLLALLLLAASAPAWGADVGVSITIGQPGFYGHLDIGGFPPPSLIYPQPLVVAPAPPGVVYAPLYLHVPPGHEKHWGHYCGYYHACGRPVYFVQDRWYNDVYVPHYRERHRNSEYEDKHVDHRGPHYHGRQHGHEDHGGPHDHGPQHEDD